MKHRKIMTGTVAAMLAVCCIFGEWDQGGNEQSSSAPAESSQVTSQQPSEGSRNSGADEPSAVSSENPTEESSKKTESEASAEATGSITPRIYEITDDEGHKLYTMGAIHIADPSILNMPEYFETAFAESDAIAVECNSSDNEFDALSIAELKYSDGTKITDHVSAEDYKKVVSIQCFR